ncbi:MAG: putative diguanylate cyclase YdaM [Synergistetes bacterium ADurb.BinA166]|nr:MAG: putative diguanylate cyclase YdaM [Synergistetes bacterium ADurb.BinA166]
MLDEPTAGLDPDSSDAFVTLLRALHQELGLTRRYKTHMSLVLVCLDDPEKPGEALGMENRERALGELLSALKGRLRPTDHVGRWNLAVLAVLTPMSGPIALQEAEAIRDLASRIRLRGEVKVKPSVGVAEYRVDLSTGELVKKAEEALAAARRAGGNRIVLAPFR